MLIENESLSFCILLVEAACMLLTLTSVCSYCANTSHRMLNSNKL